MVSFIKGLIKGFINGFRDGVNFKFKPRRRKKRS